KEKTDAKKIIQCKYCLEDIANKNFMRHLKRNHSTEKEVESIFQYPKNSKERRHALGILRNETNFNLFIKGTIRPNRNRYKNLVEHEKYYPCAYCKGLFFKEYLRRHVKNCIAIKTHANASQVELKKNVLSRSHTITACAVDPTNVISKLNVKEQYLVFVFWVFDLMKADDIAFEAKKDLLIAHFGNSYLKKLKRERMAYACSTRMRELSRLLISFRKIIYNENVSFKDILHPKHFDMVITAARHIVGYDSFKRKFKSPSLAMHLGTSLKFTCDELTHLIVQESEGLNVSRLLNVNWLENVKNFKKLVESRWNIELGPLANKDLQEKRWKKPLLLPLSILTESEKVLTGKYKRVINSGKGSKAVVILIPEIIQDFINILLDNRSKYIPSDNEYVFATPGSTIKWEAISSNKLRKQIATVRKQIATVMQILNLTRDETKQFSDFMGHTQKTHEQFYE
ncbi:hypothetical protein NQ314_008960, partial [Rhamnusium bicolor]